MRWSLSFTLTLVHLALCIVVPPDDDDSRWIYSFKKSRMYLKKYKPLIAPPVSWEHPDGDEEDDVAASGAEK